MTFSKCVISALASSMLVVLMAGCQSVSKSQPSDHSKQQVESQAHAEELLALLPDENKVPISANPLTGTEVSDSNSDSGLAPEEAETPSIEPTPPPPNFWEQVQAGFMLDHTLENRRIKVQRDWYARHPRYIDRVLTRGHPYLFHIYQEVKNRSMPMELVLLPIVESAFDPFAYSHGRASGIWQFIPGTGKMFGLKQTWWYDGRRDIVAATNAALDYLEALNKQFDGNWLHALAAYNSGAGNVRKAIRYNKKRGRPTDFWSLKLPRETQAYVPKLIALAHIFDDPEKYKITLNDIPYEQQFVKVDVGSQIDLSQAAKLAGITIEELYRYNPGFNRWATDPEGPHYLLIPIKNADAFKAGIATLPPEKRLKWTRYTIRRGDSLITIAKRHRTTVKVLKDVNNIRGNRIVAGKTLLIPTASKDMTDYALSLEQRLKQKKNAPRSGRHKVVYTVKQGDSFWTISRQFKVGMRSLAKWNGMAPTDTLRVGQKLAVWTKAKGVASNSKVRKINYRARNGDSYAKIAQKFNVTLAQLQRWNSIDLNKYLQPGDRLTLYVDVRSAP